MQEADVQELFRRFATPLAGFVALGGRKEAVEQLARNLWVAMLAGEQAEESMWQALSRTDSELCETVKRCYYDEMRPAVNAADLSNLRQRYGAAEDSQQQ